MTADTAGVTHGHIADPHRNDNIIRGDRTNAIDDPGYTYPNDRRLVPLTLAALAVMALISVALIVAAVLNAS